MKGLVKEMALPKETIQQEAAPAGLNGYADELCKPFPIPLVQLKPGATAKEKPSGLALPYVDKRHYDERLDALFGIDGWGDLYEPWGENKIICHLTILGVTKSDVGEADAKDPNAATVAAAQAFKRACSRFGLGRYFYSLPHIWGEMDERKKTFLNPEKLVREMYRRAGLLDEQASPTPRPSAPSSTTYTAAAPAPVELNADEIGEGKSTDEIRDKRARGIATLGNVEKTEAGYVVTRNKLKPQEIYTVCRNKDKQICCNCEEFDQQVEADPDFRCTDILAVKYFLQSQKELEEKRRQAEERQAADPPAQEKKSGSSKLHDPKAKSIADLVTPKQLGMIRALAREAGVDSDEECLKVLKVETADLSKKAASSFIDHLKNLQPEAAEQTR
jgi:hypothetical protein